ncbi:hypothetical protein GCM10025871_10150 [Deinococcus metallilatus]|nr:hypothetical protein GCM10025871_10150 [Deinococcus metallilatus]
MKPVREGPPGRPRTCTAPRREASVYAAARQACPPDLPFVRLTRESQPRITAMRVRASQGLEEAIGSRDERLREIAAELKEANRKAR